jgi:hypothetical protein
MSVEGQRARGYPGAFDPPDVVVTVGPSGLVANVANYRVLGPIAFIPNGITFDDLLRRTDLEWPRGVQEEEPVRWHVDRLRPRSQA